MSAIFDYLTLFDFFIPQRLSASSAAGCWTVKRPEGIERRSTLYRVCHNPTRTKRTAPVAPRTSARPGNDLENYRSGSII
ncbi:hypothetical protein [Rhizobium aegyptiacum]|uniref:hypothetical protein n=1 Tax=Rhizobium aegyptiacum TaxID=1764550 RepID=UPI0007E53E1A|nr:hypothetical protein [Rhizobium aegyptiacum]